MSTSVYLGQVVALNYATTQLEATHVPVTLATHCMQTAIHAMVSLLISFDVHTTLVSVINLYCPTYLSMFPILVYNVLVRYSLQYNALYALVYQPKHNFDLHVLCHTKCTYILFCNVKL